ncbi:MAG: NADPH-dependent FMN reductase [Devosiaceae bacterium]
MSAIKLLVLSGSTREGSLNTKLATAIAGLGNEMGVQVTQVTLKDYAAPIFDSDWEADNVVPRTITDLGALMQEADACFIASPEYNSGPTGLLKNTIDWLSRLKPHPFTNTLFSLGGASPGALGGVRGLVAVRTTLVGLNAIVMPEQLTIGAAHQAFNEDGSFANERSAGFAKAQLERLVDVAGRLR